MKKIKSLTNIGRIGVIATLLTLSFNVNYLNAQDPIPMGPGPVISTTMPNGQPQNPPPGEPGQNPAPHDNPGQNPPPGIPGQIPPPPVGNPGQAPPPPGWGMSGYLNSLANSDWQNQGYVNVMATGYDSQGVMKQIPLYVSYTFNGVNYNVTVLNAWNPYTYTWDSDVDQPAYETSYFINGFTYNYYTVLSTGTFYFNL